MKQRFYGGMGRDLGIRSSGSMTTGLGNAGLGMTVPVGNLLWLLSHEVREGSAALLGLSLCKNGLAGLQGSKTWSLLQQRVKISGYPCSVLNSWQKDAAVKFSAEDFLFQFLGRWMKAETTDCQSG